jgi:hypothetical protein
MSEQERIKELERVLSEVRPVIVCGVFGIPDDEVRRVINMIDTALKTKQRD